MNPNGGGRSGLWRCVWGSLVIIAGSGVSDEARSQVEALISGAPNSMRAPDIEMHGNVPVVQIMAPSASGVSRNEYAAFSVPSEGLVLNNATAATTTLSAGNIDANPHLNGTPARLIVNEVTSTNKSNLYGTLEVAGQRADVVVANPNGVFCGACSFHNISRMVLTTGRPLFEAEDRLSAVRVTRGDLIVHDALNAQGINATSADRIDLWARRLVIAAGVNTQGGHVTGVGGSNLVQYDAREGAKWVEAIPLESDASRGKPDEASREWAIDVTAVGGIFADRIHLITTGADVGVRNYGHIDAGDSRYQQSPQGRVEIDTQGRFENDGRIDASQRLDINARDVINHARGVIDAPTLNMTGRKRLANEGYIVGKHVVLAGDEVSNFAVTVAPWVHHPGDHADFHTHYEAGSSGLIRAHEHLSIAATRVINGPHARMISDGSLRAHRNDGAWSSQFAPPPADTFHNKGLVFGAKSVEISAHSIENRNDGVIIGKKPSIQEEGPFFVDRKTGKRYRQSEVRHVTGDDAPHLMAPDGHEIRAFDVLRTGIRTVDDVVESSAPARIEGGTTVRLRGNVVNDRSEIVAGERFEHRRVRSDQTVRNEDVMAQRRTDTTRWTTSFELVPCDRGLCRNAGVPVKHEEGFGSEQPLGIGYIEEGGRRLDASALRAHSADDAKPAPGAVPGLPLDADAIRADKLDGTMLADAPAAPAPPGMTTVPSTPVAGPTKPEAVPSGPMTAPSEPKPVTSGPVTGPTAPKPASSGPVVVLLEPKPVVSVDGIASEAPVPGIVLRPPRESERDVPVASGLPPAWARAPDDGLTEGNSVSSPISIPTSIAGTVSSNPTALPSMQPDGPVVSLPPTLAISKSPRLPVSGTVNDSQTAFAGALDLRVRADPVRRAQDALLVQRDVAGRFVPCKTLDRIRLARDGSDEVVYVVNPRPQCLSENRPSHPSRPIAAPSALSLAKR